MSPACKGIVGLWGLVAVLVGVSIIQDRLKARKARRARFCREFHETYQREAEQGDGWRFKAGCPVCGTRR